MKDWTTYPSMISLMMFGIGCWSLSLEIGFIAETYDLEIAG